MVLNYFDTHTVGEIFCDLIKGIVQLIAGIALLFFIIGMVSK
jgi:hypothetical protein